MSSQRARPPVAAGHRSIHPHICGVPAWAAVVIAMTATAIGFAVDAGLNGKQLTHIFAGCYVTGCVAAVLAVRQSGIFTAVIQPPLILFFSVPGAYWLFHGAKIAGTRDILINCGYPLIERFPLMLFTSIAAVLIGVVRWYVATPRQQSHAAEGDTDTGTTPDRLHIAAKLAASWRRYRASRSATEATTDAQPIQSTAHRPKSRRTSADRSSKRSNTTRSRHARRAASEEPPAWDEPFRRRRPGHDVEDEASRQRRRRDTPPRLERDEWSTPPQRSRFDPYEPLQPYQPQRRRGTATGANSAHQPISPVRYRQSAQYDEFSGYPRTERPRRRPPERM
ncbi:MAG: hypothetical protein K2Q25_06355 [Mycobacteriaceae bacterium]|nr:hypothetical protein [Mycobacteriaceae bacterium]